MMTLGQRIRELRDQKDLSLREFGRALGDISAAHISDIENGRRNPSDELLLKMAQVLGVKVDELKQLDNRLPVEELKRALRLEPALGFALRRAAEQGVSAEDLLKLANRKPGGKERKP